MPRSRALASGGRASAVPTACPNHGELAGGFAPVAPARTSFRRSLRDSVFISPVAPGYGRLRAGLSVMAPLRSPRHPYGSGRNGGDQAPRRPGVRSTSAGRGPDGASSTAPWTVRHFPIMAPTNAVARIGPGLPPSSSPPPGASADRHPHDGLIAR
ncbi:hypothetical protein [Actinoallomurus acaciae]|uniref:Uncharacterized protein n=1 Tax=Actinoallomurus acaciae TaxID=502577 RepID=A0ABV5YMH0_9ACTN